MSADKKSLLSIVEQGGYPDFSSFYQNLDFEVTTATSMRKALGLLKQHQPDIITAEFIYSPMYSARISNLESLFALIQRRTPKPLLLIFVEMEQLHHLKKLEYATADLNMEIITHPITINKLSLALNETNEVNC